MCYLLEPSDLFLYTLMVVLASLRHCLVQASKHHLSTVLGQAPGTIERMLNPVSYYIFQ